MELNAAYAGDGVPVNPRLYSLYSIKNSDYIYIFMCEQNSNDK